MNGVLNKRLIKIIIFLMIISTPAYAFNNYGGKYMPESTIIIPLFTNIHLFKSTLKISSYGKALVSSYLTAKNIHSLTIEVDLYQFKDRKWTSIKNWTESSTGTSGGLTGSYYVPISPIEYGNFSDSFTITAE